MRIDNLDKRIIKTEVTNFLKEKLQGVKGYYLYQDEFNKYVESLVMRLGAFYNIRLQYSDVREFVKEIIESKGFEISIENSDGSF